MASVQEMTARIAEIARANVDRALSAKERARLVNEVETIRGDLFELAEEKRPHAKDPLSFPAP